MLGEGSGSKVQLGGDFNEQLQSTAAIRTEGSQSKTAGSL